MESGSFTGPTKNPQNFVRWPWNRYRGNSLPVQHLDQDFRHPTVNSRHLEIRIVRIELGGIGDGKWRRRGGHSRRSRIDPNSRRSVNDHSFSRPQWLNGSGRRHRKNCRSLGSWDGGQIRSTLFYAGWGAGRGNRPRPARQVTGAE